MWLFTPMGFFSITQVPGKNRIQIRARTREHLKRLLQLLQHLKKVAAGVQFTEDFDSKIYVSPKHDYRYRIYLERSTVADLMQHMIYAIEYSNFKDQARKVNGPDEYEEALHDVWHRMLVLQLRENRKAKSKKLKWDKLKLETQEMVELATEFGDGTKFKVGDVVLHNHQVGRFRKLETYLVVDATECPDCGQVDCGGHD